VYAALASLSADVSAVDVRVPDDLLVASADPALLERALANVIGNALNWAPAGTPVLVEAAQFGARIHLRVVDRGAGIPRDQREAVFEPFQRLGDGAQATYDGIGLGLAVTKGFVESMGGEINVEDTPGGGTTVVIVLEASA
jgi:two-component system sensor histidine kinase KdpD